MWSPGSEGPQPPPLLRALPSAPSQEAPPASSSFPILEPLEGTTFLTRVFWKQVGCTFAFLAVTLSQPCHPVFPGAPCPWPGEQDAAWQDRTRAGNKHAAANITVSPDASTVKADDRKRGSRNRCGGQARSVQTFHTATVTAHSSQRANLWERVRNHNNS